MHADVSVVIPAYNPRRDWLDEAIRSAVEQVPPPLEVIVVDDGSVEPVAYDHPLVRVIRQDNQGVSAARNRGIREARATFIATLDADDYWLPGKLAAQVPLMRDGVVLTSTFSLRWEAGQRARSWDSGQMILRNSRDLRAENPVVTSTALFRRDTALMVGGFPTVPYGEDWRMWIKLAGAGEVSCVSAPLVVYRVHEDNASKNFWGMWWGGLAVRLRYPSFRSLTVFAKQTKHQLMLGRRAAWRRS